MCVSRKAQLTDTIKINDFEFEKADKFQHLGVTLTNRNDSHNEIAERITAANRAWFSMINIFKSKDHAWSTKEKLYMTCIRPILTYACEAWTTTKGDLAKLPPFFLDVQFCQIESVLF